MSLKLMSFNVPILPYDKHKRDWMNKSKSLKMLTKNESQSFGRYMKIIVCVRLIVCMNVLCFCLKRYSTAICDKIYCGRLSK